MLATKEQKAFFSYCKDFYGKKGCYPIADLDDKILKAVCLIVSQRKDMPFDGDSFDREKAAGILFDLGFQEQAAE